MEKLCRSKKLYFPFIFVIIVSLLCNSTIAYAFGPVTHYWINKEAKDGNIRYEEPYCQHGTGPDMFLFADPKIVNFAHSPVPLIEGGRWERKPNFGYIMVRAGSWNSEYFDRARGWGGHISADWVAHSSNLFPIEDSTLHHIRGEEMYDYYTYLKYGSINTSFSFRSKLIWKAFVNYEMMWLHEEHPDWDDFKIRQTALTNPPVTESDIESRCKWFARGVKAWQAALWARKKKDQAKGVRDYLNINYYINQWITNMEATGAAKNFSLASDIVKEWLLSPTGRNKIPKDRIDREVVPFKAPALVYLDGPNHIASLFKMPIKSISSLFVNQRAWANEPAATVNNGNPDTNWADYTFYAFWEDVAAQAEQAGILQTEEQTVIGPDGSEEYLVSSTITDEDRFEQLLEDVIIQHIQNPTSDLDKSFAIFQESFLIKGITDIDVLMDTTAPSVSISNPADGAIVSGTVNVTADTTDDVGVTRVEFYIDDTLKSTDTEVPYSYSWDTTPYTYGTHKIKAVAYDAAGNSNSDTIDVTLQPWNYIFEDTRRNTILRINTNEKTFQFLTPNKEYPVKKAKKMKISKRYGYESIVISHNDRDVYVYACAIVKVNRVDYCSAFLFDKKTLKCYGLEDPWGIE